MKKQRPILFSTPMVEAILDGSKTMTRRIIKPQPFETNGGYMWAGRKDAICETLINVPKYCPYGQPGDLLWVKETWNWLDDPWADAASGAGSYQYKAEDSDAARYKWKSSRFMPKAATRIWLEITDVKVERLQDITEAGAMAEGITKHGPDFPFQGYAYRIPTSGAMEPSATKAFFYLWKNIHGKGAWESNPWVWAISFKKTELR